MTSCNARNVQLRICGVIWGSAARSISLGTIRSRCLRMKLPQSDTLQPAPSRTASDGSCVKGVDMGNLRIGRASEEAAGIPAIWNSMLYGIGEAGPLRSTEAFLKINQVTGFDCQSCAWPSPDKKRKILEFCENFRSWKLP